MDATENLTALGNGNVAFVNVTFLIADEDFSREKIFIGYPFFGIFR